MDDKVFESLYQVVRINTVINLEIEAVPDAVTLVIVKTRSGSAYKIAALKYEKRARSPIVEPKNV